MTPRGADETSHDDSTALDAPPAPPAPEHDTLELRIERARLPFSKPLEAFDFDVQPVLRIEHLAFQLSPSFVAKGESLIITGKSGRGKTHLACSIAVRAIEHGSDALFVSASHVVDAVAAHVARGRGREAWAHYLRTPLLVLDDIGFALHNGHAASILFQIVSERHHLGRSMIVTASKEPAQWGELLGNSDAGDAIVERLLEGGTHIELQGPSMRARRYTEAAVETEVVAEDGEALCKRVARELVGRMGLKEAIYHLRGTMNFEALERSRGSRRAAAMLLGVDRRYVQRLADEYAENGGDDCWMRSEQ